MDKFLELAFINHYRNNDDVLTPYEECFEPALQFVREKLSKNLSDEFEELLAECYTDALHYSGVMGMELAIGVMNGTIKQVLG